MKVRLVKQRVCYRLTFTGWALLLGTNLIIIFFVLKYIATFLEVNKPLETKVLVVDGMMPGYGYDSIVSLVKKKGYKYLITAGLDVDYTYNPDKPFNIANFSHKVLSTKDLGDCKLYTAPGKKVVRDRTYTSALTLKKWFIKNKIFPGKINVVVFSCHARRSWILYRKAFKDFAEVGVITIEDQSYDYRQWYKASKGIRMILSETIGYIYTKIFFHPKRREL